MRGGRRVPAVRDRNGRCSAGKRPLSEITKIKQHYFSLSEMTVKSMGKYHQLYGSRSLNRHSDNARFFLFNTRHVSCGMDYI